MFEPPKAASFLCDFNCSSLWRISKKWLILVSLPNLPELGTTGTFGGANCAKFSPDDCTLSAFYVEGSAVCAEEIFGPPTLAFFVGKFSFVPLSQNFKECPILFSLSNRTVLGITGTFGGAVCVKIFSSNFTLSSYYLKGSAVCAEVIF